MGKVRATNIEPEGATTDLALGGAGQTVTFASTEVRANTFKDNGGNTIWTSNGSGTLSNVNSALSGGGMTLISTTNISVSSGTVDITSGIDSTYKEYWLIGTDIVSQTNNTNFRFRASTDGGSSWGVTMTSTLVRCYNFSGTAARNLAQENSMGYGTNTGAQEIWYDAGNASEDCGAFILKLFDPSNGTFMKQWLSRASYVHSSDAAYDIYTSGFWQNQPAVNAIRFDMQSGNVDGGTIQLFGVS